MRPHSLLAATLALAIALPASAGDPIKIKDPVEASFFASFVVAAVPLLLISGVGAVLSHKVSSDKMERNKRWEVTRVAPQGEQTALELRSEDRELRIDLTVPTGTARTQGLQIRDQLDIEPVGQAGYAVNKGAATIGVLARPDSGMVHSKPRE